MMHETDRAGQRNEKTQGLKLGWKVIETSYPLSTPWIHMRQDHILIGGKQEITYTYHQSRGSACIVPVTSEGTILLIRQYRYPVDDWCIEVPAGGLSKKAATISMEELALEELQEEVGAACQELRHITTFYPANALSEEICHVYLALQARIIQAQTLENSEFIELYPVPVSEALRLARQGAIKDGFSALSLLLCEETLRDLHYL